MSRFTKTSKAEQGASLQHESRTICRQDCENKAVRVLRLEYTPDMRTLQIAGFNFRPSFNDFWKRESCEKHSCTIPAGESQKTYLHRTSPVPQQTTGHSSHTLTVTDFGTCHVRTWSFPQHQLRQKSLHHTHFQQWRCGNEGNKKKDRDKHKDEEQQQRQQQQKNLLSVDIAIIISSTTHTSTTPTTITKIPLTSKEAKTKPCLTQIRVPSHIPTSRASIF